MLSYLLTNHHSICFTDAKFSNKKRTSGGSYLMVVASWQHIFIHFYILILFLVILFFLILVFLFWTPLSSQSRNLHPHVSMTTSPNVGTPNRCGGSFKKRRTNGVRTRCHVNAGQNSAVHVFAAEGRVHLEQNNSRL